MNDVRCIGCGGALQNTDKQAPFYTPKQIDEDTMILCQRCFRMRHYGEITPSYVDETRFYQLLHEIASLDVLIVNVLDAFDLEGSMMPQIHKITEQKDVLVVVNKRDLLPKIVSDGKLRHRILRYLKKAHIHAVDVMMVSAVKKYEIDALLDTLAKRSRGKDIYMVGATNVGKSSLINAMLSASTAMKEGLITVSNSRNTTQGLIAIPFENQTIYDTPGLLNKNHVAHLLKETSYQAVQPKKEVKPKVYQLKPEQTLFLGGLAQIDFLEGKASDFVVYVSEKLYIHRRKLEASDAFYKEHVQRLLVPPYEGETLHERTNKQISFKPNQKRDVVIPGLGFVTLLGQGTIQIKTPKGIVPYVREALI